MGRKVRKMSGRLKAMLLTNKRQRWRHNAFKVQKGLCFYCKCEMVLEPRNKFEALRECTLDHKLPVSRGGDDHWENVAAACSKCNQNKGDSTEQEFRSGRAREATSLHASETYRGGE